MVEHRERLCRFGFEYLEAALAARGARVLVMEDGELEDDLVRDVTEGDDFVVRSAVREAFGAASRRTGLRGCVTNPLSLWERVRVRAYPGFCRYKVRRYNSQTTGPMKLSHTLLAAAQEGV